MSVFEMEKTLKELNTMIQAVNTTVSATASKIQKTIKSK